MSGKKLTPIRTYRAGGKTVIRYKCECGKEFSFRSYDALPEMKGGNTHVEENETGQE